MAQVAALATVEEMAERVHRSDRSGGVVPGLPSLVTAPRPAWS
jgi:hypothetical protein